MIVYAILILTTCFAALIFSEVEGVRPAEVVVWVAFVLGICAAMYACPDLGVLP